jgi:hypothetical protein
MFQIRSIATKYDKLNVVVSVLLGYIKKYGIQNCIGLIINL